MALSPNLSRVLKAILLAFLCLTVTIHAEECTDESTCLSGVKTSSGRVMLQAKAPKHQTVEMAQATGRWITHAVQYRCMMSRVGMFRVTGDEECRAAADERGHDYYELRDQAGIPPQCVTRSACDFLLAQPASRKWTVYSKTGWPRFADNSRCTPAVVPARAKGEGDCRLLAVERGHAFYEYSPRNRRCATTSSCDKVRSGSGWAVYQSTLPVTPLPSGQLRRGTTEFKFPGPGRSRKYWVHVFGTGGPLIVYYHGRGTRGGDGLEVNRWLGKERERSLLNGGNFVLITHESGGRAASLEIMLDAAAKIPNVDSSFPPTIMGTSAGCRNILNIMMQREAPEMTNYVCLTGQMSRQQKAQFDRKQARIVGNKIFWSFIAGDDTTVPHLGNSKYISVSDSEKAWYKVYGQGSPDGVETTEQLPQESTTEADGKINHITSHKYGGDCHVMWWLDKEATHNNAQKDFVYRMVASLVMAKGDCNVAAAAQSRSAAM